MNSDSISSDTGTNDSPILCLDDDDEEESTTNILDDQHEHIAADDDSSSEGTSQLQELNENDNDAAAIVNSIAHRLGATHTRVAKIFDGKLRKELHFARQLYMENKKADQTYRTTNAEEEERAEFERVAPRDGELHYGNSISKVLWYHVLYDDGVEEFLDTEEYNNARKLYRENKKADPIYRTTKAKEEERAELGSRVKAHSEAQQAPFQKASEDVMKNRRIVRPL